LAAAVPAWGGGGGAEPPLTERTAETIRRTAALAETNVVEAVAALEKSHAADDGPALAFALGNLYWRAGRLEDARRLYEEALTAWPRYRRARLNLGRLELTAGHADEAMRLMREAVESGDVDADVMLLFGHALLLSEQPVSAEGAYRQALLLRPGDADAMLGLARCLLGQERYRDGAALLDELAGRRPERREVWLWRARSLLALGEPRRAAVMLETARRLECADSEMLADLGDLYVNAGQPADALERYEEAFSVEIPNPDRLLRAAEGCLLLGRPEDARRFLKRAGEATPESETEEAAGLVRRRLRLEGDLAVTEGRPEDAVGAYESLLRTHPLDADVLVRLGDVRRGMGRLEAARIAYERAARIPGWAARARSAGAGGDRSRPLRGGRRVAGSRAGAGPATARRGVPRSAGPSGRGAREGEP
jgi:tetratricopeptide (TPR) repeat protein